jgi:Domain of Unknown Function with PDB structure (DUF3857)/Transglutaminase-like superfamily
VRISYFLFLLVSGFSGRAQNLLVSSIDESFKENANVVVRSSKLFFEVINPGKAFETYHVELTILNSTGKREAKQYVHYSDLTKVLKIGGAIYNRQGMEVRKIKKSDIKDVSASGSNMYTDDRLKIVDFSYPSYPYSIVFEYKVQHDGLMFYPNWDPQESYYNSVEFAEFTIEVPDALGVNFYEYMVEGSESKAEGKIVYNWQVRDLLGIEPEPFGPPGRETAPYVLTTPKKFEMKGYTGSMTSWESIGYYEEQLLSGKGNLPKQAVLDLEKQVAGIKDKRQQAKVIYEYVQNTTRYVSIQLGIGGWQPYDANYVYENGYGDCKALTNYTAALLDHVGIKSIYTSVRAGSDVPDIVTEFPNTRFNHVFLAVPFERDTVWLECTSQTTPFGYTGTFTSDRHVLMATKEGGKLVKTPTYTENENVQSRVAEIILSKMGNATATIETSYHGLSHEDVKRQIDESETSRKKWLARNIDVDRTRFETVTYEYQPGKVPIIKEKIELVSSRYGSVTGKRIFFDANPINKFTSVPAKVEDRQSKVYVKRAYTEIDTIHFVLPEGYHVEHLPEPTSIVNMFGEYSASYKLSSDGIFYIRKLVRKKGVYPAGQYAEFRKMLKDIARADKTKIVLVGAT